MRARNDVPPFFRGPATRKTNFLTEGGAKVLCSEIERAWAKAGHPKIRAVPVLRLLDSGSDAEVRRVWGVKITGLINGLPIGRDGVLKATVDAAVCKERTGPVLFDTVVVRDGTEPSEARVKLRRRLPRQS